MAETPASALLAGSLDPVETPNIQDPGVSTLPPAPTETLVPPPGAVPPPNLPAQTLTAAQAVRANAAAAQEALAYREAVTRRTGAGANLPQNQEQRDLDLLTPAELRQRYGSARAFELMAARGQAEARLNDDISGYRTPLQGARDIAVDVPTAIVAGAGNILALGLGMIDSNAGATVARGVTALNEGARSIQSDSLQGRSRVSDVRGQLDEEENNARFEADRAGGMSAVEAHMRRIGRGAVAGTLNVLSDPQTLTSGVAQGVGSLLTAGPLAKVLSSLGSRLLPELAERAIAASPTLSRIRSAAPVPAAIGVLEGSGAYQQTVESVLGMSFYELEQNSPAYREMVLSGTSPEQARIQIANRAGIIAAGVQAPMAVVAGTLVSRFEGAPFRVPTLRTSAGNLIREFTEEGLQSGAGAVAQNIGIQETANENRSLTQGVGEQAAQGAILGFGTAGAVQAPGAAARAIGAAAGAAGSAALAGVGQVAEAVANRRMAAAAAASAAPTATPAATPTAPAAEPAAAPTEAPVVETPPPVTTMPPVEEATAPPPPPPAPTRESREETPTAAPASGTTGPVSSSTWTPAIPGQSEMGQRRENSTRGLLDAFWGDIGQGRGLEAGSLALSLQRAQNQEGALTSEEVATLKKLAADPDVVEQLTGLSAQEAARKAPEVLARIQAQRDTNRAENLARIAMQQARQAKSAAPIIDVLKQEEDGTLSFTPEQRGALKSAYALIEADRIAAEKSREAGHSSPLLSVSDQILHNKEFNGQNISAAEHVRRVSEAFRSKNYDAARKALTRMGEFVTHMNNKVAAINAHYAKGHPKQRESFQAFDGRGRWFKSAANYGVNPFSEKSLEAVQRFEMEAEHLARVYNGLREAYPTLGLEPIEPTSLVPNLQGNVKEAALRNRDPAAYEASKGDAVAEREVAARPKARTEPTSDERAAEMQEAEREAAEQEAQATIAADKTGTDRVKAEPKAKTEPKAEPKEEATQPATEEVGLSVVFPNLLGQKAEQVVDFFGKAYKFAKNQKNRIIGAGSPIEQVKQILSSINSFVEAVGERHSNRLNKDVIRDYKDLLDRLPRIRAQMEKNLQAFLNTKRERGQYAGMTTKERLLSGVWVNGMEEGKALNITDVNPDGSITYNQELVEAAILAGIHWLINLNAASTRMEAEDAQELLGREVESDELKLLNSGTHTAQLVRSLAAKMLDYWGVDRNNDQGIGIVDGIAEAVATEVITAFTQIPVPKGQGEGALLNSKSFSLPVEEMRSDGNGGETLVITNRNFTTYTRGIEFAEGVNAFPNAIEEAALTNPAQTYYYGDDVPPVAQTQLNNAAVKNTPEQKAMIKKANSIVYRVNTAMATFYESLDKEGFIELFGNGDLSKQALNEEHKASLEGQNTSLASAFQSFKERMAELRSIAGDGSIADVAMRYAFNVTRVGRLQMLGAQNPQSTKAIREVFLSTWSKLDMTTQEHRDLFDLALGQALGVSVHKMPLERVKKEVESLLKKLNTPIQILRSVDTDLELEASAISDIKAAFKAANLPVTPLAIHALVEYGRLQDTNNKAEFETSLYVEADGVTNGVVNAMMLLSSGNFTPEWVETMGKGGLLRLEDVNTMNKQHSAANGDPDDIYTTTLKNLVKLLDKSWTNIPPVREQFNALQDFMGVLLPDVTMDENGNVTFKRGVTKNPVTITLYGSGANGIAGKMTSLLMEEIYATMSRYAQHAANNGTRAELAMNVFGEKAKSNAELAEKMLRIFETNLEKLTSSRVVNHEERGLEVWNVRKDVLKPLGKDPLTFKLTPERIKALRQNMRILFVDPMRIAIEQTVGETLLTNADVVRMTTQTHSIVLEHLFKEAVQKKLVEKKAADPTFMSTHFLSQKELNEILEDLNKFAPIINGQQQTFFLSGSSRAEVANVNFSRGMNGQFSIPGTAYGPQDIGVGGVPILNIGYGDGRMIQIFMTQAKGLDGVLPIFDGINMPLTSLKRLSQEANKAVWESWKGNPAKDVQKAYAAFVGRFSADMITEDMLVPLRRALYGFSEARNTQYGPNEIYSRMVSMSSYLATIAASVEARDEAMADVQFSIDQMASAGAPHVNEGSVSLDTSKEEAARILNDRLRAKAPAPAVEADPLAAIPAVEAPALNPEAPVEAPAENGYSLSRMGKKDKGTGARIIKVVNLFRAMSSRMDMAASQREVVKQIMLSLGADGYQVVYGTPEQINQHQMMVGDVVVPLKSDTNKVHGVTSIGRKTIYIVAPATVETMIHELIHAATFETLKNVLEGRNTGVYANEAVKKIQALAEQFLTMEEFFINRGPEAHQAYVNATTAMLNASSEAVRLNEFMAWVLANKNLSLGAKATPAVVRWFNEAVQAVKEFIWGRKSFSKPQNDLFSNLLFNSSILMRGQPNPIQEADETVLFMSTAFGADPRLQELQTTFNNLFRQFATVPTKVQHVMRVRRIRKGVDQAQSLARSSAARGFTMNMQELTLFRNIVAALSAGIYLDPNSLAQMERYYRHVVKNLSVESFMRDPTSTVNSADYAQALNKYRVITGEVNRQIDAAGRTSLMPVFVALATVNNEFREVLKKIPPIENERNTEGTFDAKLENFANASMEKLSENLSGLKGENVQEIIDALMENIQETARERKSYIDTFAAPVGKAIDWANSRMVAGMTKLSQTVVSATDGRKTTAKTPYGRLFFTTANIMAKLASEKSAEDVSIGVMNTINRTDSFRALRTLVGDLVGRTRSNANVYDLIKAVKTSVSQIRQQFREHLPETIRGKFTRELTEDEMTVLYRALGKTDIASLLGSMNGAEVLRILQSDRSIAAEITKLETQIQTADPQHFAQIKAKAEQLAEYMINQKPGFMLLRNAESIARLNGLPKQRNRPTVTRTYVQNIDDLVTLMAFQKLTDGEKTTFRTLMTEQTVGVDFSLSYMHGQRKEEQRKAQGKAFYNALKGYIATEQMEGASLLVAPISEEPRLLAMSYVKIADYQGSSLDPNSERRAYYYAPVSGRAPFNQGIYQNVRETSGGVDVGTGFTYHGMTAGVIADPREVNEITKAIARARGNPSAELESLIPIFGPMGVAIAYERSIDPQHLAKIQQSTNFADMLGVWRGRQAEEGFAQMFNEQLNQALYEMYQKDMDQSGSNKDMYINILASDDPVVKDAVNLMTYAARTHAESLFGKDTIMVRRDMLNDALGYRKASIGDAWTGVSRWSPEVQKLVRDMSTAVMGPKAYMLLTNAERVLQNVVRDAKVLIVVKSVVVPAANFAVNILQMISRGVPLNAIRKGVPQKLAEIDAYSKSMLRKIDLEAELRAAEGDSFKTRKIQNEIQSIEDGHRRLSIWPLIERGEFSTISDAGVSREDVLLTEGKWVTYIEQLTDKLPESVRRGGKYALITRDTALFQGLQKSVAYGDFIFKAILYDDITKRQGKGSAQALAQISEEFVNYDRLPGRSRGYLEDMGLLWFYNYKIRFSKVALSIIRRNPVHALFAAMLPIPLGLGSVVDLPMDGALFMKAYDGKLDYSIGPEQGLNSIGLHPLVNILS